MKSLHIDQRMHAYLHVCNLWRSVACYKLAVWINDAQIKWQSKRKNTVSDLYLWNTDPTFKDKKMLKMSPFWNSIFHILKAAFFWKEFCLFVANSVWCVRNDLAPARVKMSVTHRCGCLLYFTITDSSLRLGIYDPNKNFHRILPSEQVTSLTSLFWPTEEKSFTINRATDGD